MHDPLIGRQLASYRVEHLLKQGGMGQVYYGWDLSLERPVAIKTLDSSQRDDPAHGDQLVAEARAVATWRHPHIVQNYYAGSEDGLYFFVMEYIDGLDVAELLALYAADDQRIPPADALRLGQAVAEALDYAHEKGTIHRDVKPANIMVTADGDIFLMDFGLALNKQHGSASPAFGTARYIAPEQARQADAVVPQSDLYALGVVLYEMLTGSLPFDDPSPTSLAIQHITQEPPAPRDLNPDLNQATEAVLLRALAKSPPERYATGRELVAALEEALALETAVPGPSAAPMVERVAHQVAARPAPKPPRARLDTRLRKPALPPLLAAVPLWLLLVGCLVLTLLAASSVGLFSLWRRGPVAAMTGETPVFSGETVVATPTLDLTTPPPPAEEPPPATASEPEPPPPPPAGRPAHLYYNQGSFYFWNPNPEPIGINAIAFEALDAAGAVTGIAFQGGNWAAFFPRVEPGKCTAIEILRAERLRPSQCQDYNAILSPRDTADNLFWLPRDQAAHFRVLWDGAEVARCATAAAADPLHCEIVLP